MLARGQVAPGNEDAFVAAGHELAAVFFALRDGAFRTGAHDDLVTGLGLAVIGESMGGLPAASMESC